MKITELKFWDSATESHIDSNFFRRWYWRILLWLGMSKLKVTIIDGSPLTDIEISDGEYEVVFLNMPFTLRETVLIITEEQL